MFIPYLSSFCRPLHANQSRPSVRAGRFLDKPSSHGSGFIWCFSLIKTWWSSPPSDLKKTHWLLRFIQSWAMKNRRGTHRHTERLLTSRASERISCLQLKPFSSRDQTIFYLLLPSTTLGFMHRPLPAPRRGRWNMQSAHISTSRDKLTAPPQHLKIKCVHYISQHFISVFF